MNPRFLRRAILVLFALVALLVLWRLRKPPEVSESLPAGSQEPTAARDAERGRGVAYSHVRGESERWSLKADEEYLSGDGGRTVDGNVRFEVGYSASGERDILTIVAQHAEHDPEAQRARFSKDVEVTTGSGLSLETDSLTYDLASGVAETESRVRFRRKALSGRSRGLTYESREERIVLPADVELVVREEEQQEVHISADRGTLARETGVLLLTGNGRVRSASGQITGPRIKATLSPESWRLSEVVVNGGASLLFDGGEQWTEQAGLQLGPGRYRVESQRLQVWLGPEGVPQRIVAGPKGALMEWRPPDGGERFRRLEAGGVDMDCDEQGRVRHVKAHKNVHVTQTDGGIASTGGGLVGEAWAVDLVADLDPDTGAVSKASLLRDVRFTRGQQLARCGWAVLENGEMRLGEQPEMIDTQRGSRLTARHMRMGTGERRGEVEAEGNVRHLLKPAQGSAGNGLLGDASVIVSSEYALFDYEKGTGLYRTATVLRSGESEVQAHSIEIEEQEGRRVLDAFDDVVTRWRELGPPPRVTRAAASHMRYDEGQGILHYDGNVDFSQPGLSVKTPGVLEARLDGGEWKRLEATGDAVDLVLEGRAASGTRMVYSLAESELELEGQPAQYADSSGQVSGRSLTVRMADDTILIDGRQRQRTRMMIRRAADPAADPTAMPTQGDASKPPKPGPPVTTENKTQ